METKTNLRRHIVLFHGLLNPDCAMWILKRRFESAGFGVTICGYRSWGNSIRDLGPQLATRCQVIHDTLADESEMFFVGHSMGAILIRDLLSRRSFPKLKRVVMLAPPNRGSHVARRFARFFNRVVPAIEELSDHPESLVNQLPSELPVEFGVISAKRDHVIHSHATRLGTERDFVALSGRHGALIFRIEVFQQTLHFIEHGTFARVRP